MAEPERIGVFGGTFDPVHIGHLLLAESARVQAKLSRILFMPAHIQPFKQDVMASADDDRINMLRMAIRSNRFFDLTTIETDNSGISYTIDSLRRLRAIAAETGSSDTRLCFIIGMDMFLKIEKWKDADALLREFDFAVGVRPGYRKNEAVFMAERLYKTCGTRVDFIDNPPIELSSSEIRERVKSGETIRYRVSEDVRRYLLVREREGEKRFAHTKRVMELAAELAVKFGIDPEKAELSALLHDYCKDNNGGIKNDLAHGSMAADAAKNEFGIIDGDVLNAIRFHTTGRARMSGLEKIIFIADTVEPGRKYEEIESLRKNCFEDLDQGILSILIELKKYLLAKGLNASRDTEEAIEFYSASADGAAHTVI